MYFLRMQVIVTLIVSTTGSSVYTNRGEEWRRFGGSHLHGRYGLWYGMLLSSDYLPGVQRPRSQTGLRCACTSRTHHGRSAYYHSNIGP